jgi:phosphoglycerate kinase
VACVKKYLPSYAGLLLEHEIENLNKVKNPKKPLMVIIGGAKMKTKIAVIKKLTSKADHILLGGALANNFLAAKKLNIGKSLIKKDSIKMAKKLMSSKLVLPVDVVVANGKKHKNVKVKTVNMVGKNDVILDIGPQTMKLYAHYIKKAQTIIWNGPMGMFETKPFHHGTIFMGRIIASRSKGKAFGLIGGGETVQALRLTKMFDDVDWVSTGGGASLAYLGGNKMPGLKKIVK